MAETITFAYTESGEDITVTLNENARGPTGANGGTGAQGDRAGLKYTFSTSTGPGAPSPGYLKFNSATLSAVTRIAIRDTDFNGSDTTALLALIDDSTSTMKARVLIRSNSNSDTSNFNFLVTSVTDEGNHFHINGTYVSGSAFADDEVVTFDFYITGDSGSGGGAATWGSITGTLSSQTDLDSALALKAPLISPSFTTPSLGAAVMNAHIIPNTDSSWSIGDGTHYLLSLYADSLSSGTLAVGYSASGSFLGKIYLYADTSSSSSDIRSLSTSIRINYFPDASGTLALTSDIKSPGGSSGDVQYNDAGAFGGVSGLTLSSGVLQTQTIAFSSAGATPNTGQTIINSTAATAGVQSASPAAVWAGNGWKTTATAASQDVRFRAYVLPIQGTTNPTGSWVLQSSINSAAYAEAMNISSAGALTVALSVLGGSSGVFNLRSANSASGGLGLGSLNLLAWGSTNTFGTGVISGGDTILARQAAANVRQGAVDAAAPVGQTSSVQSVSTGTSNTAGANRTYSASQGTGTGAGGKHIFRVATAGTSGTAQNPLVTALEIREDRSAFIANVSAAPATPTGGGLLYVEAGALKYIGSSGTITTLGAA